MSEKDEKPQDNKEAQALETREKIEKIALALKDSALKAGKIVVPHLKNGFAKGLSLVKSWLDHAKAAKEAKSAAAAEKKEDPKP